MLAGYPPFSTRATNAKCLEIASGTGQHAAYLAKLFSHVTFWPSEYGGGSAGPEEAAYGELKPVFDSIAAHCEGMANVKPPVELNAAAPAWPAPVEAQLFDAVYASNVCHISPYAVTEGIFAGAVRILCPGTGHLFLYGPFMVDGEMVESNHAFDARLKSQDATWGVRDSTTMAAAAAKLGLDLVAREAMPANNILLVFVRRADE